MTKQTAPATPVATPVNSAVVELLKQATEKAASADALARDAAVKAVETDCLGIEDAAARVDAIIALYKAQLEHRAVRMSFAAAVAILVADKPVRFAVTGKVEKADGRITLQGAEALAPVEPTGGDEIAEGKMVVTMEPSEAIAKLAADALKMAAPKANEAIGKARAARHTNPVKKATARAPFFDELAAVIKDAALAPQFWSLLTIAAQSDHSVRAALVKACEATGHEVKRLSAKAAAKA